MSRFHTVPCSGDLLFQNFVAFSVACTCYAPGSVGMSCNQTTGQCQCTGGAEGLKCDVCKDFYFNVTTGCLGINKSVVQC